MNSFSIPVPHVLLNITNTVCCPLRRQPGLQFVQANSLFVCGTSLLHNLHKYKVGNVEPWNCEIAMSEKQPSIFKFCDQFHLPTLNYVANFTSMAKPIWHPFHSHKALMLERLQHAGDRSNLFWKNISLATVQAPSTRKSNN